MTGAFTSPLPGDERMGMWLATAHAALTARKAAALRPLDLTVAQYAALLTIGGAPRASASDVARACLVTPQSMAVTVGILERRGLVERERGPARGRARGTALTAAGRALLQRADRAAVAVERDAARALTGAERAALRALLERAGAGDGDLPGTPVSMT